jgi:lipopolysaccharide export system protein LptA
MSSAPPRTQARRGWVAIALAALALWAAPAMAQGLLPGGGSELPIEITADSLVVRQQDNLAVFSGNVNAVQGALTLRADELQVLYGGEGGAGSQSIRRIDAVGNVVVVSEEQTASGDRGSYDPAGELITLEGNVVLTQAGNVIRAGRLDYALATGVVTLTPPAAAGDRPARVRALFQPEERRAATSGAARP